MPATTDTANPANITSEQIAHFLASAGDGKPKTAADVAFAVAAFEARHVLVAAREASFALFGLGAGVFCDGGAAFLRRVLAKASKPALSQLNPPQKLAPNAVVEARIKDAKRLKTIQKSLADDLRHVLLLFNEKTKLRPTIDQDTSLAAEICLLITALDLNSVDSHVLALADTILSSCLNTYKSHNNQKKAFQLYLSKLLDPTLSLRQCLKRERVSLKSNDAASKALISSIGATIHTLLDTSLFHKEHMPEYVAALQIIVAPPKSASTALSSQCSGIIHTLKSKDSAKASYPKLLFDRLLELSKDGPQEHVVTMFPHLLASFIISRKRHAKLQDSNLVFSVDFASFLTLLSILVHSTAATSKDFTDSVKNLMLLDSQWSSSGSVSSSVIGNLVRVLVEHDVYKATQDNVSKQQLSAFKDLNSVLVQIVGGLSGSDRGVVFDVLGALMQVDHSVVVDSIDALWIYLVVPDTKSRASALQFTLLLLQTLTQSRELESFFTQCFNALSEFSQSDLTDSILLENAFLKALSTAVSKTLPAQLPHLLTFLTHQFFSTPEEDDEPAQKRRTTEVPTSSPQTTLTIPESVQILAAFLARLVKSGTPKVASADRLREQFDAGLDELYQSVIVPIIQSATTPTTSKRPRQDPSLAQDHGFTLLLALMQSSEDFWKRNVSTEFIISVVGTSLSDSDLITLMKVRVSLFHAECVASNSLDPRMEGETASLVTMALERVQTVMARGKGKGDGVWDGSLKRLEVGVAVWAALLDHLVPVCHLASNQQIESIVETLIETVKGGDEKKPVVVKEGQYTLRLLSASLFQSSQFYELRAIRDIFLSKLIKSVTATLTPQLSNSSTKAFHVILNQLSAAGKSLSPDSPSIPKILETVSHFAKQKLSAQVVNQVSNLIAILNTFPTVYFQNHERDCLVSVLILLELAVPETHVKAMCRKLEARMMESRDDTLVTLYSPRVLEWFLEVGSSGKGVEGEVLRKETWFIYELTISKLIQRATATLPKGSIGTPVEYLTFHVKWLSTLPRNTFWLEVVLCFLRAIVSSLPAKKHEATDMDVDKPVVAGNLKLVVDISNGLLKSVEEYAVGLLEQIRGGTGLTGEALELEGYVSGFRVFEQLMLFKEGYGVLDNTKSLHEMFIFADECLATMSKLIQSSESSSQIVDLGALFLSIQLHQLEGQPAEATVEESVLENLVNSCWTLLKAAWGKNANAVSVIHRAISTFAFKCAAMTFVPSVLKLSLDLMEALTPLSVGLDNVLSNSWDLSAALNLVTTLVTGVQKSGKRSSIRKVFQRIVVSLSRIIEGSGNVDLVVQSITLLTRFSEDRILELSRSDLSLILNACSLLAAKHSPLFKAAGQTSESTFLGPDDLFDAVCRLLTSILTQRREPLVDSIPAYVGVIRGLLHCFKQDLGGLQASSESSGNNIPTFIQTPYPYFSKLKLNNPIAAAESLARILEKMTQKSAIGSGASKETATAQTILQSNASATVRPFSKHAGLLVSEFVAIQASLSPFPGSVKKALLTGIFALLDLSGEFGRKSVLAGLDALQFGGGVAVSGAAAKLVYKDIVKEWEGQSYKGGE